MSGLRNTLAVVRAVFMLGLTRLYLSRAEAYWQWRDETAFGSPPVKPEGWAQAIAEYAVWCRRMARIGHFRS